MKTLDEAAETIAWALANPNIHAVEVEAGRMTPVPDFIEEWQLARWMGVSRRELLQMMPEEIEEARIAMIVLTKAISL